MDYGEAVTEFEQFYSEAYYQEIAEALKNSKNSLVIDFQELDKFNIELTRFLKDNPQETIDAATEALIGVDAQDAEELEIRITNMPEEDFVFLRNLRSQHIGKFIPVEGMIKRASQVKPEVVSATFECVQCGDLHEKEQDSSKLKSPYKCECGSRKFEVEEKHMTDTQTIIVEENPENREGSEQPSSLSVRLEGDLVDPEFQKKVIPGNVAHITGVLKEKPLKKNSKKYDVYLEANYLKPIQQEFEQLELTEEEKREIKEMAQDPKIFAKIVNSIAPSIYGHTEIKKAIALQLFGGVKKTREDGVKSRGDIHILLIGEPGTGKCVAPDTNVRLSNGKKKEIGKLIENKIETSEEVKEVDDGYYIEEEIETLGIDKDGKIEEKKSSKMWKREAPEKMYKIKTSSGREIEITPSHPLFIQKHGNIAQAKAEELTEGTFIATPRELDIKGDDTLEIDYRKSVANNAIRLEPIKELDPGFCRLLGYIVAEGYIQQKKDNSSTIYITNNDEKILEDIKQQFKRLNVNYTERKSHEGKTAKEIHCSASELSSFLTNLEPSLAKGSRHQKFPEEVLSASEEQVKSFIKAYVEADGTVSKKEREIVAGSTSKALLEDLKTALLRLGIQSQLKSRKDSFRLRISGRDFERYRKKIGFVTERKNARTEQFDSEFNTNTDVVPNMGELLRDTREKLELSQFDFPIKRGAYQHYERLDRNPTIPKLEKIIETFEERIQALEEMEQELENASWNGIRQVRNELNISQSQVARNTKVSPSTIGNYEAQKYQSSNEEILENVANHLQTEIRNKKGVSQQVEKIKKIVKSDIFWDKIEEIEEIKPEYNFVYDLEIPEQHNYLTNGIISHNSQLLKFTGELAPKGRYVVGKSSSGAGLTASVVKDESTGEFSLEAGAVVLAHKGMATIDEIDKMSQEDRSSLHEAMEQQCFAPDSLVTLADGSRKEISEIVDGLIDERDSRIQGDGREVVELEDKELNVLSADLDRESLVECSVSMAGRRAVEEEVVALTLENDSVLEVTKDHPVYIKREEIDTLEAVEIEVGDDIFVPTEGTVGAELETVEVVDKAVKEPDYDYVYDLTVPETHNFIVENTIAHNSISVSKANIQAKLNAETSILAAGNPKLGRFDPYEPIPEQISIGDTLLSRFDFIFPVKDEPDQEKDQKLATQILQNHIEPEDTEAEIDQERLRKYIAYAKRNIRPDLTEEAADEIQEFYIGMRNQGSGEDGGSVPITARQLEALIRIAEASARAELRDEVLVEDSQRAIDLLKYCLEQVGVDPETGDFDIDMIESGVSSSQRNRLQTIKQLIENTANSDGATPVDEVLEKAQDEGIQEDKAEEIIEKLKREGELFEPKQGFVQKI